MTREQVLARLDAIRARVLARRAAKAKAQAAKVRKRPRVRREVKVYLVINGRKRRLAWDRYAFEYRDVVRRSKEAQGARVEAVLAPVHAFGCAATRCDDGAAICTCGADQMLRDVVKLPARPNRKKKEKLCV